MTIKEASILFNVSVTSIHKWLGKKEEFTLLEQNVC